MSNRNRAAALALAERVGDADRNECVEVLTRARALGTLSADEFEERVDRAWRSRVRADLDVLTVDLPAPAKPGRLRRRDPRHLGRRTVAFARFALPLGTVVAGALGLDAIGFDDEFVAGSFFGGVAGFVLARMGSALTRDR